MPTVPSSDLVAVNNLGANFPGSPAQSGLVVGPTVSGTANAILLDDSINAALTNFGTGPGTEYAGTALVETNHGTVYQIKTPTSTVGVAGSVTKTEGATVGTVVYDYGAVLVAGATFNGDVLFTGKVAGAELEIVSGGAEAISVVGSHVLITNFPGTTTGTSLAALITGTPAALALWGATAIGTGASLNSTTLSTYAETAGRIGVQALAAGISVRTTIPAASQPRIVALTGGTIVDVQLATDANAEPLSTETAINIQSDLVTLAANNPGKFTSALAGSGAGRLGAKALTALPFGSTGTMTVSGAPNDGYDVSVQVVAAGTLGTAAVRVSLGKANGVPVYDSATYLIPIGGAIVIPGTGLTLTFAGVFDVNDLFSLTCTAPLSTLGDIATALTYFIGRPEMVGLIAIAGTIPVVAIPAWVASMNVFGNQLQAAKKYCRILLEYEGPASGQTNAAWAAQVAGILAPLSGERLSLFGGSENLVSALPLPQPSRFEVVNGNRSMFARALALPSGIDVGDQTVSGQMTGVTQAYQTDVAATLAGARSSYLYLLAGFPGVQCEGLLFDAPTGDFTYLVYGRVLDEGMFYAYLRQTKYLNTAQQRNADGTIKTSAKLAIEKDLTQVLTDKMVKPGNCSGVQVVVDGTNTDNRLVITYYFQLNFYVKRIDGRAGVVRIISGTQVL